MAVKVALALPDIKRRLQACDLPAVDLVVGIGSGGIVPAALVAYEVERPLTILSINFRAPDNTPRYEQPRQLGEVSVPQAAERLLLVDDVSVSGRTLALAKQLLGAYHVITLVMKGTADIVLFPEIEACVQWPWKAEI